MKCYLEGDTKAILYNKITPERLELDVLYKKWQSALVGGASTNALIDRRELRPEGKFASNYNRPLHNRPA